MSTSITFCPQCGQPVDSPTGVVCDSCKLVPGFDQLPRLGATPTPEQQPSRLGVAFLVWAASVGSLFLFQIIALVIYWGVKVAITGATPVMALTPGLALVSLIATGVAHLFTLGFAWWFVTGGGKREFFGTLGWRWHHQFKWVHAGALAVTMLLVAFGLEKLLPHGETDFERMLQLSTSVRIAVALLAVLSAPLVEEVVYRGVLYSALERARGWKFSAAIVTLMFALVHVPQYLGSPAAIAAILTLSLVLTLLRAGTGSLLPCVATHFIFNGIQAVVLLVAPPERADATTTALISAISRAIGFDFQ